MSRRNRRCPRLKITADGAGIVNHVGARLLADLADQMGLTAGFSVAMAPTKQRRRGHDCGGVLVAVMLTDGRDTGRFGFQRGVSSSDQLGRPA